MAPMQIEVKYKIFWGLCAAFLAVCAIFSLTMNPIVDSASIDSAVFAYIGDGMVKGILPYRDMFDHKGPLLYLINWFGVSLGIGYQGVWIIESTMLVLSFSFAVCELSKMLNWRGVLLALFPIGWLFERLSVGGNMTETYAVYFSLIAWSSLARDVWNRHLRILTIYVQGFVAGAILMLRPNMIGFCLPVAIAVISSLIRSGDFAQFFKNLGWGAAGLLTAVTPIVAWLSANGILSDFWNCYISFNIGYMSNLKNSIDSNFAVIPIALALNVVALVCSRDKLRLLLFYNLAYLCFASLLVVMKMQYEHYFIPILPALIVPFAVILNRLMDRLGSFVIVAVLCVFAPLVVYWSSTHIIDTGAIKRSVLSCRLPRFETRSREVEAKAFQEALKSESSALVLGNACEVYHCLGVRSKSRYFYTSVVRFSPEIGASVEKSLVDKVDDYVICRKNDHYHPDYILNALRENYHLVSDTEHLALWESNP